MEDYDSYPYVTNLNEVNKPLAFPSIIICNTNIVRLRKIDDLPPKAVRFLEQYAPPTEFTYTLPNDTATVEGKRRKKVSPKGCAEIISKY